MSRGLIRDDVTDSSGNALSDILVDVFLPGTMTRATLYDASVGGSTVNNPLTTNTLGVFEAFADTGEYDLVIQAPGGNIEVDNYSALDADDVPAIDARLATAESEIDTLQGALPAQVAAAEAAQAAAETAETNAVAAQVAAEAALDSFDDRYLGTKTSDPALDNDGDPLLDGALYFNTTLNRLRVYDQGTASWIAFDDSETLDGLDSTQFLRSDVADQADGLISFQAGLGESGTKSMELFSNGLRFGAGVSGANRGSLQHAGFDILMLNHRQGGLVSLSGTDSGGTGRALFTGNPDAETTLYYNGTTVAQTTATGLQDGGGNEYLTDASTQFLRSDVGDTATGNYTVTGRWDVDNLRLDGNTLSTINTNGNLTLQLNGTGQAFIATNKAEVLRLNGGANPNLSMEDTGTLMARLEADATNGLILWSFRNGKDIRLNARDTGGTDRNCITMNPDSAVNLFHVGSKVVETNTGGINFGTGVSGANRGQLQALASGVFLDNNTNATPVLIRARDGGGTLQSILRGDPGGVLQLHHAGLKMTETTTNGLFFGVGVSGANRGGLRHDATALNLTNNVNAGTTVLLGSNAAAGDRTMATFDPNGAVTLRHAGTARLATTSTGIQINSGPTWTSGTGTPEGVVTASVGSLFSRTDGGASTTLYVKESGAGNTGWVAK